MQTDIGDEHERLHLAKTLNVVCVINNQINQVELKTTIIIKK
jgi:hypothetical protein